MGGERREGEGRGGEEVDSDVQLEQGRRLAKAGFAPPLPGFVMSSTVFARKMNMFTSGENLVNRNNLFLDHYETSDLITGVILYLL